jgi:hypothetical protein
MTQNDADDCKPSDDRIHSDELRFAFQRKRSMGRWPLLFVSVLLALSMVILGALLSPGSPNGPGSLFVLLAFVCIAAVIPFFVPSSRTAIVLARIVIALEGALVATAALGLESAAHTLVSMGNSHSSGPGPVALLGIVVGLAILLLGLFTGPAYP